MKKTSSIKGKHAATLTGILTEAGKDFLPKATFSSGQATSAAADIVINVDAVESTHTRFAIPGASSGCVFGAIGPASHELITRSANSSLDTCALDFRFFAGIDTGARLKAWQQTMQDAARMSRAVICLAPVTVVAHGITLNDQPISAGLLDLALALQLMDGRRDVSVMLSGVYSAGSAAIWSRALGAAQTACQGNSLATWLCIDDLATLINLDEIVVELQRSTTHIGLDLRALATSYIRHFFADPMRVLPDYSSLPGSARFLRAAEALVAQVAANHSLSVFSTPITMRCDIDDVEQMEANIDQIRDQATQHQIAGCDTIFASDPAATVYISDTLNLPTRTAAARTAEFAFADLLQNPRGKITAAEIRLHARRIMAAADAGQRQGKPALTLEEYVDPATFVLACSQLWQWARQPTGILDEGKPVNRQLVWSLIADEGSGSTTDISWLDTILDSEAPPTYELLAAALQGL